ncbi:MAG: chain-length determining protein [Muribaculaceae bacterium]|nr:chain-length determining protein [Muribaculaceae bacterium]
MKDMQENNEMAAPQGDDKEIDLIALAKKLWQEKKLILIWCVCGAVLGLIIAFSIPKAYTTEIKLSPEFADAKTGSSGGLGALASMAGINMSSAGADALSPQLYPDIIKSVPFSLDLLSVNLTDIDGERKFTLEQYLEDDVKSPWWSVITGAPGKLLALLKSDDDEKEITVEDENGPIVISMDQFLMLQSLEEMVTASVDEKTFVVSISVTMQDPMVSAVLADTVANRLKEFVTNYRTEKARQDLWFIQKLNDEARENYYAAQQRYANYLDTHQGIVLHSAQTMRDRLENEATLAFNVFNQTSQQLNMAKAKVQEQTPVYATLEPATVPVKASKPRKVLILAGFIFLSFVGACAWILFVRPLRQQWAETKVENREEDEEADVNDDKDREREE